MTNLYPNPSAATTAGDIPGQPGATPSSASTSVMQGNPSSGQYQPAGVLPPGPINSSAQALASQISNGQIPLHTQPTNVNVAPGLDSLLAQISRGQVVLKDSNYGNAVFAPASSPANQASANVVPIPTGQASAVTVPSPVVYSGN